MDKKGTKKHALKNILCHASLVQRSRAVPVTGFAHCPLQLAMWLQLPFVI